jgi:hypothetical protein
MTTQVKLGSVVGWFKYILLSNIYNGIEHKFYNLYKVLSR